MDIIFKTAKERARFTVDRTMIKLHGPDRSRRIRRRLDQLRAAETLQVMRNLPGRCHELTGDRAGQLSLDLDHPYRLIFSPANHPIPTKADGGLNWAGVTAVLVIGVEDTHV